MTFFPNRATVPQVFAPNDDAFHGIDVDYYCDKGLDELVSILTYHVGTKVVPAETLPYGNTYVPTVYGTNLMVKKTKDDVITVNNANVILADGLAYNGMCSSNS